MVKNESENKKNESGNNVPTHSLKKRVQEIENHINTEFSALKKEYPELLYLFFDIEGDEYKVRSLIDFGKVKRNI